MAPMPEQPVIANPEEPGASVRRGIMPLLAGYWAFGQYWGVWVILVYEVQRDNGISNAGMGARYTLLSGVAVLVMLLVAPRMQRLPLSTSVPVSLATLAIGA